jgi:hypothetical protein
MRGFGFDLDNTIIDYSDSVVEFCKLSNIEAKSNLPSLRQTLKKSDLDQESWIEAQSWIYSKGLEYAKISDGLVELCKILEVHGFELAIFSHKTQFGPTRYGSQPFIDFAAKWIAESELNKFFTIGKNVSFFESIDAKVNSINSFGPDYYIDDLLHVFKHPIYNMRIKSFLYKSDSKGEDWLIEINHFSEVKDQIS